MIFILFIFIIFCTAILYFYYPAVYMARGRGGAWLDIMRERKERVEEVCRKYKEIKYQNINYGRFRYSSDYNLMFCLNAKGSYQI